MSRFGVVDLFAGPGGLAEGFSSVQGSAGLPPFQTVLSVEKDASAHSTLLLRSFLRQFKQEMPCEYIDFLRGEISEPDWGVLYPEQWAAAGREARCLELGSPEANAVMGFEIDRIRERYHGDTVLIGGPPCQAYSLVGRARNQGIATYVPRQDTRHFLYREYISILRRLRPAAFVMENVKGILSASIDGENVFGRILEDLNEAGETGEGYRFVPIAARPGRRHLPGWESTDPRDYVVKAELHGVPQARHRVILVGIREDVARKIGGPPGGPLLEERTEVILDDVLAVMPPLRSGLSRTVDDASAWLREVSRAIKLVAGLPIALESTELRRFQTVMSDASRRLHSEATEWPRQERLLGESGGDRGDELGRWLCAGANGAIPNHESRGHMPSDLTRYVFAAAFAAATGHSPKASAFPSALAPLHRNWTSGKFSDRFRVQIPTAPSTTITSHIAKDGHYFIHPDPAQARSLTVREAARLQTFPDNYVFKGNRTQQYTQVGNAVPPFLARQIAEAVLGLLDGKPQAVPSRDRT